MRIVLVFLLAASSISAADSYQRPPKPVADALNALPTPTASVSPQRDYVIFMQSLRYPSISEVAQPMLRLAGIRIDTDTNGMHLAPDFTSYSMKRLSDGGDIALTLPSPAKLSAPIWSPDSKQFAFTNTSSQGLELWIGSTATGQTHRVDGVTLNGVVVGIGGGPAGRAAGRESVEWMDDNRTLLVRLIPAGRGAIPVEAKIPLGPHAQQSLGKAGPAPTYEDLLSNPHDEDLFDYYATSALAYLDSSTGKTTPIGRPGIFTTVRPSPDGGHLLVERIHRPYSYQLPAGSF